MLRTESYDEQDMSRKGDTQTVYLNAVVDNPSIKMSDYTILQ